MERATLRSTPVTGAGLLIFSQSTLSHLIKYHAIIIPVGHFLNSLQPLFQSESACKAFAMAISFHSY